ncbi:hypothetical protein MJT46_004919 [Ovis ammon polii x Ovis aries]|nr:hypothetical protein MJT46_004919 [Ovis ammon polii x Ovis aries]
MPTPPHLRTASRAGFRKALGAFYGILRASCRFGAIPKVGVHAAERCKHGSLTVQCTRGRQKLVGGADGTQCPVFQSQPISKAGLEDFLNQSSPFYFWINGDRIDSLMENDRQQSHMMDIMEDSFNRAPNTMDELFQHRFFPQRPQDTQYYSPFSSFPRGSLFFNPKSRFAWNLPFPVLEPLNFHDVFQPFYNMIHQAQQAMDAHLHRTPYHFPMVEFAGENNDRTMCKEISYNSTRCLWMKGQCAKCQEILEVDCSANIPTQTLLCQQLNESLQLVEKFSRLCDQLLQSFQQKMLDTSALLKQLIEQFTWVSQLAHLMQSNDQYHLQVSTEANTQVQRCTETSLPDEAECHDPILWVVVKLFNPFPITVMVLQEVPSPNFMENVVEKALQQYCQKNLEE